MLFKRIILIGQHCSNWIIIVQTTWKYPHLLNSQDQNHSLKKKKEKSFFRSSRVSVFTSDWVGLGGRRVGAVDYRIPKGIGSW